MKDRFTSEIEKYMLPMDKVGGVIDSTYFLRRDMSLAFAQGYCHPPGGFYGKLINYPDTQGHLDIFGRKYSNTNKRMADGKMELIPVDEQLALQCRAEPALGRRDGIPPFAEYHLLFDYAGCVGYFGHRRSLEVAVEENPWLEPKIARIGEFIEVPRERLGVTGSLAYGKIERDEEDIDLVVYGSVDENRLLRRKIAEWVKDPANRVVEFGKFWPMRFFYEGILVCPFFIYGRSDEIPLSEFTMEVLRGDVRFSGRVKDDRHSIYLPILLGLEGVTLDGEKAGGMPLIIYDSSLRGEFSCGARVEGRGKLVNVRSRGDEYQALLVTTATTLGGGVK